MTVDGLRIDSFERPYEVVAEGSRLMFWSRLGRNLHSLRVEVAAPCTEIFLIFLTVCGQWMIPPRILRSSFQKAEKN